MRFTPTRVGKTPATADTCSVDMVHPHACGEDSTAHGLAGSKTGSPPRVWGRPEIGREPAHNPRFTPTRVGKTGRSSRREHTAAVHPHACGEDCHSRGVAQLPSWFTPTRVGKTRPMRRAMCSSVVHPHACGEDPLRRTMCVAAGGSPPRVWGRPAAPTGPPHLQRFTPTRVGKTRANSAAPSDRHGSPPRVWGRRERAWRRSERTWFTPTRVGKTRWTQMSCACGVVHPHACGEDASIVIVTPRSRGSPPRVWGRR